MVRDPIERTRVREGQRTGWPISAPANKISQALSADGERVVSTIWRSPSNPDDICSAAKIR
jgi:hypothetical protein